MKNRPCENATPETSHPDVSEEPNPLPLFEAAGKEVDLDRCRLAYRIGHRHPRLLLRWLETWTRVYPDKPLPAEIVRELPHLRRALDQLTPVSPALARKIRRELAFEHLEEIGQPVGIGVARDLAATEVALDLAREEKETGVKQDMRKAVATRDDPRRPAVVTSKEGRQAEANIRRYVVAWRRARSRGTRARVFGVVFPALEFRVLRKRRR